MADLTEQGLMAELIEMEAWADMMDAMPEQTRMTIGADCSQMGGAISISAKNVPLVTFNRVMGFGLRSTADRATLDSIVGHLRRNSAPVAQIQVAPFATPAGIDAMLSDAGFVRTKSNWAKMGRRTDKLPDVKTSLEIAEVTPESARGFAQAVAGGFGMPPFFVPWLEALASRERWRCYIARDGEDIVAGSACFLNEEAAWLGVAATLPQARNKGAQGALIASRLAVAAALGKTWAYTETGILDGPNPSLANMYRTGFECLHERMNWSLAAQ